MRAFELRDYIGPDGLALADVADPIPGPDDVLIKVEAVGVNFPDLLITQGLYQLKPALPFVPGCEVAGVVESAPTASGLKTGDQVAAFTWTGGFAEKVAVPASAVAPVPDGFTSEQAAGLWVNYHTSLFALQRRAHLQEGAEVLVMGAAGGIGTASVQVARGLGASVIAGVANEGQKRIALEAGANDALVLDKDFAAQAKDLTTQGRGFDVIVDPLGSWLFTESVRALAPEGQVVVIGFAAGDDIPAIRVNRLLLKNVGVIGAAFGAFLGLDDQLMARQARALAAMAAKGHVRPQIEDVYDFDAISALLHRLSRGEVRGKAVMRLCRSSPTQPETSG